MTHKPKNKKKMMKFKLNILALALFGFGLASCTNSFLDVESKTESSTGNYYKTESDAYRALWFNLKNVFELETFRTKVAELENKVEPK